MPALIHVTPATLLAQTATPPSGSQSTIVYWIAIFLVAAGLAIFGIVGATALRGRKSREEAFEYDPAVLRLAADSTPVPERASQPRDLSIAVHAPIPTGSPSPTTLEAQNLLRLMGEAEDLCARLGRSLDEKADRLERLLARAEGRLGNDPIGAQVAAPAPGPRTPGYIPPAPTGTPPQPEIVTRPVSVPAPATLGTAAPLGPSPYYIPSPAPSRAAAPTANPASRSAALPPVTSPAIGVDGLTREIYALADAGHSVTAIAQQLGQHAGKIELILALRPN